MRRCFENTATPYSEEIFDRLWTGLQAQAPVLWLNEMT
jgi:hypothetical protein